MLVVNILTQVSKMDFILLINIVAIYGNLYHSIILVKSNAWIVKHWSVLSYKTAIHTFTRLVFKIVL